MTQMTQDQAKLLAAKQAVGFISDGMKVGLGSGTTATMFIHELAKAVQGGLRIEAIATSVASEELARSLGIPLTNFEDTPFLDVNVDGADEVGPGLALIKGGGGALLREKIVAPTVRIFLIVDDESKVVQKVGEFPLPVEVIQMAAPLVVRKLADLGLNPVLRKAVAGPGYWITDEENFILDCHCGEIENPEETAAQIRKIVGVVEHGLFLGMASKALIAGDNGIRELLP
jgi:ribose 5-phosphate isomerase A